MSKKQKGEPGNYPNLSDRIPKPLATKKKSKGKDTLLQDRTSANIHAVLDKEKKEYSLEEGLEEIIKKIDELYKQHQYVVISVAGPYMDDVQAGKTTLCSEIMKKLKLQAIPCLKTDTLDGLEMRMTTLQLDQERLQTDKGVIIIGAHNTIVIDKPEFIEKIKAFQNEMLTKEAKKLNLPLDMFHLRIVIYSVKRELEEGIKLSPSEIAGADIIIRNERLSKEYLKES